MFPPANRTTFTTQRGAILDGTTAGFVDAVSSDAEALEHAGWTRAIEIGTTANRPVPGAASDLPGLTVTLKPGYAYYDTTLSAVAFWSASKQVWVGIAHTAV